MSGGVGMPGSLDRDAWERANRELIAKFLTELAFEDVLHPEEEALSGGRLRWRVPLGRGLVLHAEAVTRMMGRRWVDPATLGAERNGVAIALPDAAEVAAVGAPHLGSDPSTTAGLVHEVAMTAISDTLQLQRGRPVGELLDLDPALLEGEMRGHPWIVAGKGRVGFGARDLAHYAPELAGPLQLGWLALDPAIADARAVTGLEQRRVVREQVGEELWGVLRGRIAAAGLDPAGAVVMPVHPWQWENRIAVLHAGQIARGQLVHLGALPLRHLAQQSIRTVVDADHPERRYMKLSLSILNTSVHRGLPRRRTLVAPALTEWFLGLIEHDPFLASTGLIMLGEVASVSVAHPAFESIAEVPYQHTEMLGAIWRQSVEPLLAPGERAITMAALIHRDPAGGSLAAALIARSGLAADDWIARLHRAVLPPLLHVLYRYGAAFSPHAQNCLVVLRNDIPTRLVVKDFVDDAMITSDPVPELGDIPPAVRAALGEGVEAMVLSQWIQAGLFVAVYRYMAEILADAIGYPERRFWAAAERVVAAYQEQMADELGPRFGLFDFEAPAFVKLCLNRVRLLGRGYGDGAERPVADAVGWIDNPLAPTGEP